MYADCIPGFVAAPPATAPAAVEAAPIEPVSDLPPPNPDNNVYFGDVHVHTGWSFDAFTNGSKTPPTDAYAWAQCKAITGSGGPEMQIKTPLPAVWNTAVPVVRQGGAAIR